MSAFGPNAKVNPHGYLYHVDVKTGTADSPSSTNLAGTHNSIRLRIWKTVVPKYKTAKSAEAE